MKKWLVTLCLFMLVGCGSSTNKVEINIMSPYGAPSIALIPTIKHDRESVTLVSGADLLLAELVKATPDYKMVIAPINLGLSLINKEQTNYRLLAIVSWGNLYIIGEEGALDQEENILAMFGKEAVPQKIADFTLDSKTILAEQVYFPSVLDASAQLITNKAQAALLAEPFLTKTLSEHSQLSILVDIQARYNSITGLNNYPQAALFVDKDAFASDPQVFVEYVAMLRDYVEKANVDPSILKADLDEINAKELGLPGTDIVVSALTRMNLDVVFAYEKKDEIKTFMELFNVKVNDSMMVDPS